MRLYLRDTFEAALVQEGIVSKEQLANYQALEDREHRARAAKSPSIVEGDRLLGGLILAETPESREGIERIIRQMLSYPDNAPHSCRKYFYDQLHGCGGDIDKRNDVARLQFLDSVIGLSLRDNVREVDVQQAGNSTVIVFTSAETQFEHPDFTLGAWFKIADSLNILAAAGRARQVSVCEWGFDVGSETRGAIVTICDRSEGDMTDVHMDFQYIPDEEYSMTFED